MIDGKEYDATVVGGIQKRDLALIKYPDAKNALPSAAFGDSDNLEIGDWVVAIGNPFGLGNYSYCRNCECERQGYRSRTI